MKEAAIFDIDKTLLRGNTGVIYSKIFLRVGLLKPSSFLQIAYNVGKYLMGWQTYELTMERAYAATRGMDEKEMKKIILRHYKKKVKPLIYPQMKAEIAMHRKEGRIIIFATNAWSIMSELIAKELKPDIFIATQTRFEEGVCTGELLKICYAESKSGHIKEAARENQIDLSKSYAYSDHHSDRFMLESVGNPVAVNPDKKLAKIASKKGWRIMYLR